ncbi:MAG: Asp-tRNA(Asn)/Glu-tRNA(Gln) amidotransferase subunit GatA [Verrucomicrobiota bacterium]
MPLYQETIASLKKLYAAGEATPAEVIASLAERRAAVDGNVQGYLEFDPDDALAQAEKADLSKPLGGVPIAIKDLLNVEGSSCRCASKILEHYTAPYDAHSISRLREAGAILLGRTNMDEFAMGSSTENSAFAKTKNPWDLDRIPGGSSGGSAAVVAADEAIAALGTDTGGSIRQPAALCGCVGMKPTYGRVSRFGLVAFASSLDQIGPMTKTVEDAALLLEAISGHDARDNTSAQQPVPDFSAALGQGVKGMRLGVPKQYFVDGMDPEVETAVRAAIAQLEELGAETVEVDLPHTEYAVAVYYIVATAEASANLARFDGVRYGNRIPDPDNLLDMYKRTRGQGFGPEVKRRVILGTYVLSSGYYDAYYNRAMKVRELIRRDFAQAFEQCDALLTPTSPTPAFKVGEKTADPLEMYLADIFTIAVNLAGVCGISVPCGFTSAPKLPVGLQIIGPHWGEAAILRVAHAYEQATAWSQDKPAL